MYYDKLLEDYLGEDITKFIIISYFDEYELEYFIENNLIYCCEIKWGIYKKITDGADYPCYCCNYDWKENEIQHQGDCLNYMWIKEGFIDN